MRDPRRTFSLAAVASAGALLAAAWLLAADAGRGSSTPSASSSPAAPLIADTASAVAASADVTRSSAASTPAGTDVKLRGRVVYEDTGEPVAGATVALRYKDRRIDSPEVWARLAKEPDFARLLAHEIDERAHRAGGWRPSRVARARDDGTFEMPEPPRTPGFLFEVTAPFACDLRAERVPVAGSLEPVVLVVKPAGRIEGVVLDAAGGRVPHADVIVRADLRWDALPIESLPPASADARGAFAIDGLLPGNWTIHASAADGPAGSIEVAVAGRRTTRCEVRFEEGATVVGRVVDESGRAIEDATVRVGAMELTWANRSVHWNGSAQVKSRSDGSFRFTGLPPSTVWVGATKNGMRRGGKPEPLVLAAGEETSVELVMAVGESLAGVVVDASDQPLAGVSIGVSSLPYMGGGGHRQYATTDGEGRFLASGLVPGLRDVRVMRGRRLVGFQRVPANQPRDGPARIVVARGTVAGVVRDASSGDPIRRYDLRILLQHHGGSWASSEGVEATHIDSESGAFEITDLPSGELELRCHAEGHTFKSVVVTLAPGESKRGLSIELESSEQTLVTSARRSSRSPSRAACRAESARRGHHAAALLDGEAVGMAAEAGARSRRLREHRGR